MKQEHKELTQLVLFAGLFCWMLWQQVKLKVIDPKPWVFPLWLVIGLYFFLPVALDGGDDQMTGTGWFAFFLSFVFGLCVAGFRGIIMPIFPDTKTGIMMQKGGFLILALWLVVFGSHFVLLPFVDSFGPSFSKMSSSFIAIGVWFGLSLQQFIVYNRAQKIIANNPNVRFATENEAKILG